MLRRRAYFAQTPISHPVGLAGEQTVKVKLANTPGTKEKCRDAWTAWWKESADQEKLVGELHKRTLKDVELVRA